MQRNNTGTVTFNPKMSIVDTDCKVVNAKYDINLELFFQVDEGGRRGHDQKVFKKRFRLVVFMVVSTNKEAKII